MVRLTITEAIVLAIQYCDVHDVQGWPLKPKEGEPLLGDPQIGNPISHGQIIDLSKCLSQHKTVQSKQSSEITNEIPDPHLATLLQGSQVYIEPPKPKSEPTPEFKALMAYLRQEEEAKAYYRMMKSSSLSAPAPSAIVDDRPSADDDDEMTYADINRQVALIINVLLSIVACSVALWMAARHWSPPTRLGLSMGGGGLVGIAEVVIYAGYLRRISEAKQKEKKKVEKKEVFETWVIERNESKEMAIKPKESRGDVRRRVAVTKES